MKISLVKNEHIMAYREGRLGEIPAELLVVVEEREKANKPAPKEKKVESKESK